VIHLYLARGLHTGDAVPDEGEFINACVLPLAEAVAKVMAGEIQDAKTALGILMAHHLINA
jgi:ADP-ribose pyrophosphatase